MTEGKKVLVLMEHLRELSSKEEPFASKAARWAKYSGVALAILLAASTITVTILGPDSRR